MRITSTFSKTQLDLVAKLLELYAQHNIGELEE